MGVFWLFRYQIKNYLCNTFQWLFAIDWLNTLERRTDYLPFAFFNPPNYNGCLSPQYKNYSRAIMIGCWGLLSGGSNLKTVPPNININSFINSFSTIRIIKWLLIHRFGIVNWLSIYRNITEKFNKNLWWLVRVSSRYLKGVHTIKRKGSSIIWTILSCVKIVIY